VNQVLRKLAASGIVLLESRPPSNLYRLNHDHVAAEGIAALARMWTTLVRRIRAELDGWSTPPEAAWLFGSAARGEATAHSDIDILLVVADGELETEGIAEVWERQTEALAEHIKVWSGNVCEMFEMTRSELADAVERDDRLIHDLRGQAISLAGHDPRALLRRRVLP
jgi:predicted nucleotidyltransferase